jgi:hypothetical protein
LSARSDQRPGGASTAGKRIQHVRDHRGAERLAQSRRSPRVRPEGRSGQVANLQLRAGNSDPLIDVPGAANATSLKMLKAWNRNSSAVSSPGGNFRKTEQTRFLSQSDLSELRPKSSEKVLHNLPQERMSCGRIVAPRRKCFWLGLGAYGN